MKLTIPSSSYQIYCLKKSACCPRNLTPNSLVWLSHFASSFFSCMKQSEVTSLLRSAFLGFAQDEALHFSACEKTIQFKTREASAKLPPDFFSALSKANEGVICSAGHHFFDYFAKLPYAVFQPVIPWIAAAYADTVLVFSRAGADAPRNDKDIFFPGHRIKLYTVDLFIQLQPQDIAAVRSSQLGVFGKVSCDGTGSVTHLILHGVPVFSQMALVMTVLQKIGNDQLVQLGAGNG